MVLEFNDQKRVSVCHLLVLVGRQMNNIYIIGEFGSCHEETLGRAVRGAQVAAAAGCDAFKVQFWSNPKRMRERRHIPEPSDQYLTGSIHRGWFDNLKATCQSLNIHFGCSVYLPEDVETVAQYVNIFKVSSFEARSSELTREVLRLKGDRPFFLSTGMQTSEEDALLPREAIYLHCVSAYPCPIEQANLGAIEPHEGYSDHTRMVFTGALAVASGAEYLETHYRLDDTSPNAPDFPVSLTPKELKNYVHWARTAALMRGDGIKRIQDCERENLGYRVLG